jgi:predicted phosphodiesterase
MVLEFITDIHEDITSLQKAFKLLEQEKVDSIICLGDNHWCWR